MVKLLLTSTFRNVADLVRRLVPDPHGVPLAFIATAGNVEIWGRAHAALTRHLLRRLGFAVRELDVAAAPPALIRDVLNHAGCIYVGGGNTFYLLRELRRSGAAGLLAARVRAGTPYIGESAGAVVAGPDIGYCAPMDHPGRAPGLRDLTGLGLVGFRVVPHYRGPGMGRAARTIIAAASPDDRLRPLTDRQAVLVDGPRADLLTVLRDAHSA